MAWSKHYIIGVSVGVMAQPSAVAVVEQETHHKNWQSETSELRLRHLERLPLSASYPDLTQRLRQIVDGLAGQEQCGEPDLLADITGTGKTVIEFFEKQNLKPIQVVITSGHGESEPTPRKWRIAKVELVGALQVLFQTDTFKIASGLELVSALREELTNFRMTMSAASGENVESWRVGAADDLVFAVALATWRGKRHIPANRREMDLMIAKINDPKNYEWVV